MKLSLTQLRALTAKLLALSLVACGGGGGDAPAINPTVTVSSEIQIIGSVSKGPLQSSLVDLLPIDAFGAIAGAAVASTITDSNGGFTASIPAGSGALLVRARGGSYVDEADREPDPQLRRRIFLGDDEGLESILLPGLDSVTVSVVTQALIDKTRREIQGPTFLVQFQINRDQATAAFGFDVITTTPADPTSPDPATSVAQRQYAMLLGGLANLINRITVEAGLAAPTIETILAASNDLSDGRIDGMMGNAPVLVGGSSIGVFSLNDEIARFQNNNFDAYVGTPMLIVDEGALSQSSSTCDTSLPPALVSSYEFDGNFADSLGNGAALTSSGGNLVAGRYVFDQNQGLRLTDALPCITDYAIEIRFQANDSLAGYNKLIDFQDLNSDLGLYVLDSEVDFFTNGLASGGMVALNQDTTITLARSNNQIEVLQDGVSLFTAADDDFQAVPLNNILNFFVDDFATGQGESFAGSVDFIRIHRDTSTLSNIGPVAIDDSFTLLSSEPLMVAAPGVLANDSDPEGEQLSAILVAGPAHAAAFDLQANGSFSYTHDGSGNLFDSFTYNAVDPSGNSATATVNLIINNLSLVLSAQLPPGLGSATVEAFVDASASGGSTSQFVTTAAADGQFSITITADNPQDFVSLTATGAIINDNDDIILRSLLGSFQTLQNAAGSDNVLDSTEQRDVEPSHVSTTLAVLAEENSLVPINSDAVFADAIAAVDPSELLTLAITLSTAVNYEQIQIGSDITTLEALTNERFRNELFALIEVNFDDLLSQELIDTTNDFRVPYILSEVPERLYFTTHGNFLSGGVGGEFMFNPDGTGFFANINGASETSWSIDANGDLLVLFPIPLLVFDGLVFIDNEEVQQINTIDRISVQRLIRADRADHVFVRTHTVLTYPQNPEIPTEEIDAPADRTTARLAVSQTIPFIAADLAGRNLTANFYHQDNNAPSTLSLEFGFDTLEFNTDGSGVSQRGGFDFSWVVDAEGILNITFSNGDLNRLVGLLPEDEGVINAVTLIDTANSDQFVRRSFAVTRDESLAFDLAGTENTRLRSLGATEGTIFATGLSQFDFEFQPGEIACRTPGSGAFTWNWTVVDGRVEIQRILISDGSLFASRTLQPVRLTDSGFWLIEVLDFSGVPIDSSVTVGRTNIYRLQQELEGNGRPTANDDNFALDAGTTTVLLFSELFGNDSDPENDEIVLAAHDFLSANDGTIETVFSSDFDPIGLAYTPAPGFAGIDSFNYSITDLVCSDDPTPSQATVSINVLLGDNTYLVDRVIGGGEVIGSITTDGTLGPIDSTNILSFNLSVNDGTDVFVMSSPDDRLDYFGSAWSATDSQLIFDSSLLIPDPSAHCMRFNLVQTGITANWIIGCGDPGEAIGHFDDGGSFGHTQNGCVPASVEVGFVGAGSNNIPCTVNPPAFALIDGGTLTIAAPGVLQNSSDADGDMLTAILVAGPARASAFNLEPDGSFVYTHDGSGPGTDSFSFLANDGAASSNVSTVTININANAAVIYTTNGDGLVTGAENVNVNGVFYSVTFQGGNCADTHLLCDNSSFEFTSQQEADIASQTLFDQVLLDGVIIGSTTYNLDTETDDLVGCAPVTDPQNGIEFCRIHTAWNVDGSNTVSTSRAGNWSNDSDNITAVILSNGGNLGNDNTYAVWRAQPVPLPRSGLTDLAGFNRVRLVDALTGVITTAAGGGGGAIDGGGPATGVDLLSRVNGIAVDGTGGFR